MAGKSLLSHRRPVAIHPLLLLLGSMVFSYMTFFLPWVSLTVRPIINSNPLSSGMSSVETPLPQPTNNVVSTLVTGQPIQIVARFWESQPKIFTGELVKGFSPRCSIRKVEWQAESKKQIYDWLYRLGWGTVVVELGIWLINVLMQRKAISAIPRIGLALAGMVACVAGILILALLGPSASCPQLMGVIVEQATPIWPTLLVSFASVGLGLASAYIHSLRTSAARLSANHFEKVSRS